MSETLCTYKHDLISVIIPFFNHADLVIPMIESIQANSDVDWEMLLVDDGSEAEQSQLIKDYVATDSRIQLLQRHREPKGAPTCRNIGLQYAQGEYICFFDSDDLISPTCLSTRLAAIKQHPNADFLVFPSAIVYKGNIVKHTTRCVFGYPVHTNDFAAFCRRMLPFVVCTNIYRADAIQRHQLLWDEHLTSLQDSDFNMQALTNGLQYEYITTEPDYFYRIDASASSVSKSILSERHLHSHIYGIDRNYQRVHARFGNQYDRDLYQGILYVYNIFFHQHFNKEHALLFCRAILPHDPKRSHNLYLRTQAIHALTHIVSEQNARRIVMVDYLIRQIIAHFVRNLIVRRLVPPFAGHGVPACGKTVSIEQG